MFIDVTAHAIMKKYFEKNVISGELAARAKEVISDKVDDKKQFDEAQSILIHCILSVTSLSRSRGCE